MLEKYVLINCKYSIFAKCVFIQTKSLSIKKESPHKSGYIFVITNANINVCMMCVNPVENMNLVMHSICANSTCVTHSYI